MKSKIVYKFNQASLNWSRKFPRGWSHGWLTHLVILGVLSFIMVFIGSILPMTVSDTPDIEVIFGLGFLPAAFWWIFMIYRMVKYNADKLFGNRQFVDNVLELPTIMGQFLMPFLLPILFVTTVNIRVASLLSYKEIYNAQELYNNAIPFLTAADNSYEYFDGDEEYLLYMNQRGAYQDLYNSWEDDRRNELADSIQYHKGAFRYTRPMLYPVSMYQRRYNSYLYSNNDYKVYSNQVTDSVSSYFFVKHRGDTAFVTEQIDKFLSQARAFDFETGYYTKELVNFFYQNRYLFNYSNFLNDQTRSAYYTFDNMEDDYTTQLSKINKAKQWGHFVFKYQVYLSFLFIAFLASLLMSLFKNLDWKEFLVSVFVLVLIPILLVIFGAVAEFRASGFAVMFTLAGGVLITLFLTQIRNPIRKKRNTVAMAGVHLLSFLIPIAIVGILDEFFHLFRWGYFDRMVDFNPTPDDPDAWSYNDTYYLIKRNIWWWSLLLGAVLYTMVGYPLLIKKAFIKHLAKPRKS